MNTSNLLIESDELIKILGKSDLVIIDTRPLSVYSIDHIPGAINIPEFFSYICTDSAGGIPEMVSFFKSVFEKNGINNHHRVVIYEDAMDNGYGQSCRGWFILNLLGHKGTVSVLHGGYKAWQRMSYPLTNDIPSKRPTTYKTELDLSIIVTKNQVLEAIGDPSIVIVDVRDYAEWIGANSSPYGYDYCPRKGRIPSAKWLEWYRTMTRKNGIPYFKENQELLDLCALSNIPLDKTIILYCFKGARTSNVMLALTKAGLKVKNYFSSWNEWSRDLSLPISEGYPAD
ncbi:MAG: rhodanese-like domain-containing protein [candidate division WOR-3 bacterium]